MQNTRHALAVVSIAVPLGGCVGVDIDGSTSTQGRMRPMCEYTNGPRYNGSSDVNSVANLTCVSG